MLQLATGNRSIAFNESLLLSLQTPARTSRATPTVTGGRTGASATSTADGCVATARARVASASSQVNIISHHKGALLYL